MSSTRARQCEVARGGDRPAVARRQPRGAAEEHLHAVVAGDRPALVEAMAATLPAAGFAARCVYKPLEIAARVTSRSRRSELPPLDLVVFVLSREAWTFVALLEVLVAEVGPAPIVVFTDGATLFGRRLRAMGLTVVEHLPFDLGGAHRVGAGAS